MEQAGLGLYSFPGLSFCENPYKAPFDESGICTLDCFDVLHSPVPELRLTLPGVRSGGHTRPYGHAVTERNLGLS